MFGIGMPEMILILAIALIVIGPKKLPDLAKALGRAMGEFKKATREFKETIEINTDLEDVKKAFDDMNPDFKSTLADPEEADKQAPEETDLEETPLEDTPEKEPPREGSPQNGSG